MDSCCPERRREWDLELSMNSTEMGMRTGVIKLSDDIGKRAKRESEKTSGHVCSDTGR